MDEKMVWDDDDVTTDSRFDIAFFQGWLVVVGGDGRKMKNYGIGKVDFFLLFSVIM